MKISQIKNQAIKQKIINIIPQSQDLGGIFIGCDFATSNLQSLKDHLIKVVITVQKNTKINFDSQNGIIHNMFEVVENKQFDLLGMLDNIVDLIHKYRNDGLNILINCETGKKLLFLGMKLAPCIVIAYMIKNQNYEVKSSLIYIQGKQPVNIQQQFILQLKEFYIQTIDEQCFKQNSLVESRERFRYQKSLSSFSKQSIKNENAYRLDYQRKEIKQLKGVNKKEQQDGDDDNKIFDRKFFVQTKQVLKGINKDPANQLFDDQLKDEMFILKKKKFKQKRSQSILQKDSSFSDDMNNSHQNINSQFYNKIINQNTQRQSFLQEFINQNKDNSKDCQQAFNNNNFLCKATKFRKLTRDYTQNRRKAVFKDQRGEAKSFYQKLQDKKNNEKFQETKKILRLGSNYEQNSDIKTQLINQNQFESIRKSISQKIIAVTQQQRIDNPNIMIQSKLRNLNSQKEKKDVKIQNQLDMLKDVMCELYSSVQNMSDLQKKMKFKNVEIKNQQYRKMSNIFQ